MKKTLPIFILFLAFGIFSASSALAATPVYYSVGQDATTDLKTGTPTVSLSSGVATFSVAQTGNIGVGDVVTYDTDKTCNISGKTSQTVWSCVTATGGVPTNITGSTVVSIKRVFTSLSGAEDGAPALLGTSDLVTGNFQLNFPCYYDTGADTTAVEIYGWTTGVDNFIKVYTPNDTATEVNFSQRHEGVWDEGKYIFKAVGNINSFKVRQLYAVVEGMQVECYNGSSYNTGGISPYYISSYTDGGAYSMIKNNIIRNSGSTKYQGILNYINDGVKIINNAMYGHGSGIQSWGSNVLVYGNVIYGSDIGIDARGGLMTAKNNAVFNNTDDFYLVSGTLSVSYCASDDGDGTNAVQSSDWNNVFQDIDARDFRLKSTDTDLIDAGEDLGTDYAYDILGNSRPAGLAWDIGAHEAPVEIFRSVGPGATASLNADSRTVEISGSTATFSGAMPDNVGVGDVLQYQVDSPYHLAFIHARTSDTVYSVRKADGTAPTATPAGTAVSVFRAYTSLANAEKGVENTGIETTVRNFDDWTAGGTAATDDVGRDLVTNNEQWNIACYANGSTADTTAVTIAGWTTGEEHYLKVYTPVLSSEVGVSQRHQGKWDDGKYRLEVVATGNWQNLILVNGVDLKVQGIQVLYSNNGQYTGIKNLSTAQNSNLINLIVSDSIFKMNLSGSFTWSNCMYFDDSNPSSVIRLYNNVIYDSIGGTSGGTGIRFEHFEGKGYIYNNTVYNCHHCISGDNELELVAKNNITQNCVDGFFTGFKVFDTSSDFNISDISGDAPNVTFGGGYATVQFVDEANDDFHLAPNDTSALGKGTDLSSDTNLPFSTDIDGETRARWDIGADEMGHYMTKTQGAVRLKGSVKFK
jgi:hypothetical protein